MAEILKTLTIMQNGVQRVFALPPDHTEEITALKSSMSNKADANHGHSEYADKQHTHEEFYTKNEIDTKLSGVQTGGGEVTSLENYITKGEAAEKFAPRTHTHTEFARTNHTHTGYASENHSHTEYANREHKHTEYANKEHTHEGFASVEHNHNEIYYTKTEVDAKIQQGGANDVDLSGYYNKSEVDNKIAGIQQGGSGNVDLSNYYTKQEVYNKTEIDSKLTAAPQGTGAGQLSLVVNGEGNVITGITLENNTLTITKGNGESPSIPVGCLQWELNQTSSNGVAVYVNPETGVDNATTHGLSEAAPLQSIDYALSVIPKLLKRGVKIYLAPATYPKINVSGFTGNYLTIEGLNSDSKPVVQGINGSFCTRLNVVGLSINSSGTGIYFSNIVFLSLKNSNINGKSTIEGSHGQSFSNKYTGRLTVYQSDIISYEDTGTVAAGNTSAELCRAMIDEGTLRAGNKTPYFSADSCWLSCGSELVHMPGIS